jgi:uncharacterized pyridoxal phosphate-containing UPF0001 family protein
MDLAENLALIESKIKQACGRVSRDPGSVSLLAVTKGKPPEAVRQLQNSA